MTTTKTDAQTVLDVLESVRRDYEVALNNSYAAEAIMGDSYPEIMQNNINRKFVSMQLGKIAQALPAAQRLVDASPTTSEEA